LIAALEAAEPSSATLSVAAGRLKQREEELALRQRLAGAEPHNRARQADLAASLKTLGLVLLDLNRFDEASPPLAQAVDYYEELARSEPEDPALQAELGPAYLTLGELHWNSGPLADGAKVSRRGLALL
jgi:hypothetical protein